MNGVIGEILPLAVGVAISPLPIIAAILMLLSPKARTISVGFLLGWVIGITLAVVIFTLVGAGIDQGTGSGSPVGAIIKILLGALLLFLAIGQWRKRPREGTEPTMPKWMSAIDSMTAIRALLLGLALAAINPKNLMMAVSAGVDIGTGELTGGQQAIVIVVYVVIAAITVVIPVIGFLVAADRVRAPLEAMRVWLTANNAVVMSVLLLVIGVVTVGKGIAAL
jgi:hypothetical protein